MAHFWLPSGLISFFEWTETWLHIILGHFWTNSVPLSTILDQFWANLGQIWTNFGPIRPDFLSELRLGNISSALCSIMEGKSFFASSHLAGKTMASIATEILQMWIMVPLSCLQKNSWRCQMHIFLIHRYRLFSTGENSIWNVA